MGAGAFSTTCSSRITGSGKPGGATGLDAEGLAKSARLSASVFICGTGALPGLDPVPPVAPAVSFSSAMVIAAASFGWLHAFTRSKLRICCLDREIIPSFLVYFFEYYRYDV